MSGESSSSSSTSNQPSWWQNLVKDSAPGERDVYSAYALLENQQGKPVGSFILGIYQMAKAPGGLRVQKFEEAFIEAKNQANKDYAFKPQDLLNAEDPILQQLVAKFYPDASSLSRQLLKIKKTLYRDDDSKCSPFELAFLPTHNRREIQRVIRDEYVWQQEHGLLPQEIFRLRMDEWLGRIAEKGLKVKASKGIKITIDNPKPKDEEKSVHKVMEWVALISSLSAVVLTVAALTSPLVALLAGIGTFIAYESANNFHTFDMGEWLWKDLRWSLSKNFLSTEKFSLKNTLKSLVFLAAIGYLAFAGAAALYAATLSFPLLAMMSPMVVQGIAAVAAVWSFVTTMVGLSIPIAYLRGMSFHDNQVDPKEIPDNLPPMEKNDAIRPEQKLNALTKKLRKEQGIEVEFGVRDRPKAIRFIPVRPQPETRADVSSSLDSDGRLSPSR